MLVRVWNKNDFDHTEKFRGAMVTIPAHSYIEMEREDAVMFKSAFTPPKYDKGGLQLRESMKIISIEPIPKEEVKSSAEDVTRSGDHVCMACGFEAGSAAGLKSHIRHQHEGQMVDEDAREKLMKDA